MIEGTPWWYGGTPVAFQNIRGIRKTLNIFFKALPIDGTNKAEASLPKFWMPLPLKQHEIPSRWEFITHLKLPLTTPYTKGQHCTINRNYQSPEWATYKLLKQWPLIHSRKQISSMSRWYMTCKGNRLPLLHQYYPNPSTATISLQLKGQTESGRANIGALVITVLKALKASFAYSDHWNHSFFNESIIGNIILA